MAMTTGYGPVRQRRGSDMEPSGPLSRRHARSGRMTAAQPRLVGQAIRGSLAVWGRASGRPVHERVLRPASTHARRSTSTFAYDSSMESFNVVAATDLECLFEFRLEELRMRFKG